MSVDVVVFVMAIVALVVSLANLFVTIKERR